MTFVSVAVPVPTLGLLTYRVPDDLDPPAIGARVVVPLGTRTVTGIVVSRDVAPINAEGTGPEIRYGICWNRNGECAAPYHPT